MRGSWWTLVAATVALGCGGSKAHGKGAETSTSDSAPSKGEQCLLDATSPRKPKPDAPEKIALSHILVRHADVERPMGATRSREQACLRALAALAALKGGTSWEEGVKQYSDAPGPGDGSLGRVGKDDLDPTFAGAAFSLDVDELSYVVETKHGFHVVLRRE
jgi:hypothetical protein